ncbi:hypothetical protein AAFF_G00134560 [Aldrovandia affinis]|uniref:Uncharacterized protein n=1 Tax=Aldrovandia affinis TaxID=143900 RepID=A0AAD7W8Z4_9TELE|nr:hypothetical protein AAFF_G00134560 [Aldrovandia affinis]
MGMEEITHKILCGDLCTWCVLSDLFQRDPKHPLPPPHPSCLAIPKWHIEAWSQVKFQYAYRSCPRNCPGTELDCEVHHSAYHPHIVHPPEVPSLRAPLTPPADTTPRKSLNRASVCPQ